MDWQSDEDVPLQELCDHEMSESGDAPQQPRDYTTDPLRDRCWKDGDRIPPEYVFSGRSGIMAELPDEPLPIDFVNLLITDDFF